MRSAARFRVHIRKAHGGLQQRRCAGGGSGDENARLGDKGHPGPDDSGRGDCVPADSFGSLTSADLRGLTITSRSLSGLVRENGQLAELRLPAGCDPRELRPLRQSALRRLTVERPPGHTEDWLPERLQELDITGEAPVAQALCFLTYNAGHTEPTYPGWAEAAPISALARVDADTVSTRRSAFRM